MTAETVLTDEKIITIGHQARAIEPGGNGYILPVTFARALEQAVLQSVRVSRWIDVSESAPYCEGSYVVRINRHGHLRLGGRAMNPDTLRYQWQVDGEICNTVTHYLPIPALQIAEKNK